MEFPGVLVFGLEISKVSNKNVWHFQGWSFLLSEIFLVKKSKIPGEGVNKVAMSSTLPFGFRKLGTFTIPCRKLARHLGKVLNTLHCVVSYPFLELFWLSD